MPRLRAIELRFAGTLLPMRSDGEPDKQRRGSRPDRGGSHCPPHAVGKQHEDNGRRAENGETYGGGDPGPGSKSL